MYDTSSAISPSTEGQYERFFFLCLGYMVNYRPAVYLIPITFHTAARSSGTDLPGKGIHTQHLGWSMMEIEFKYRYYAGWL
jgi:hypothetical protein